MAKRILSYLQGTQRGELVSAETFERILLPYEWSIIQALGVSEQEYRQICQRIAETSLKRSPAYAHVPDIEDAAAAPALINLAIGLVLTGVGMLLAPKPQSPSGREEREQSSIVGANQEGRTRFNQNIGFDGAPQIAQLGSRIPIIFGRYRKSNVDGISDSGGILAEPLLVWSQILSKGTYQTFKGIYVVCERGIETFPESDGYLMGGQPIDDIYDANYELFFSSKNDSNYLTSADSQYGEAAPGDPFTVVTNEPDKKGFCSVFSPANKSVFGLHGAIRNGGRWSLNWRVINLFSKAGEDDPGERIANQRRKICGAHGSPESDSREGGMRGTGRWYSPQMGLWAWRTDTQTERNAKWNIPGKDNKVIVVDIGWSLRFRITPRTFRFPDDLNAIDNSDPDSNTYDDINSSLNSIRSAADDSFRRGEIFCCNQTLLQVDGRSGIFEPCLEGNKDDTGPGYSSAYITLKVVGFIGSDRRIGLCGSNIFSSDGVMAERGDSESSYDPGAREANWFSLAKCDVAQVKNTRPCEVTEIGIKSQVWTQISGLCNFADVPVWNDLANYDREGTSVSNGSINKYTWRTSFFMLAVRVKNNGQSSNVIDGFDIFEECVFAVRGRSPVDQFNYIRIAPNAADNKKYEYRLIPLHSTQLYNLLGSEKTIYILGIQNKRQTLTFRPVHTSDTFDISFQAEPYNVKKYNRGESGFDRVLDLEEVHSAPQGYPGQTITNKRWYYSNPAPSTFVVKGFGGWQNYSHWYQQMVLERIFGTVKSYINGYGDPKGTKRSKTSDWYLGNTKKVRLKVTAEIKKRTLPNTLETYGTQKYWKVIRVEFADENDQVQGRDYGEKIGQENRLGSNLILWYYNRWKEYYGSAPESDVRSVFDISRVLKGDVDIELKGSDWREWEDFAQIKEVSGYDQITRSCDNGPEHEIVYVNESDGINTPYMDDFKYTGMTTVGVKFKSMNQTQSLQPIQVCLKNGMSIPRLNTTDDSRGATDLLSDIVYFLLTSQAVGLKGSVPTKTINKTSFTKTGKFLANNRLFFNGAISDKVNFRSYVNQIAPYFLIHLSVRNGKFFMTPALPTTTTGDLLTTAVPVSAYFNDSNIADGSFKLQYIETTERRDFRCVIKYREPSKSGIPEYATLQVRYKDTSFGPPQEEHDLTQFCSNPEHALLAAKYLLASRRRIDHTIEFETAPQGMALAPGDYIKVDTTSSPLEPNVNARVSESLQVLGNISDGTYNATIYRQASDAVTNEEITIKNGSVADATLGNALMAIPIIQRRLGIYHIEELSLTETGLVSVKASHHPVNQRGESKINRDILPTGDDSPFIITES